MTKQKLEFTGYKKTEGSTDKFWDFLFGELLQKLKEKKYSKNQSEHKRVVLCK